MGAPQAPLAGPVVAVASIFHVGSSRNVGTWSDSTIYYEVVPTDALEKIFWIDSDRMGLMINTVTP